LNLIEFIVIIIALGNKLYKGKNWQKLLDEMSNITSALPTLALD